MRRAERGPVFVDHNPPSIVGKIPDSHRSRFSFDSCPAPIAGILKTSLTQSAKC